MATERHAPDDRSTLPVLFTEEEMREAIAEQERKETEEGEKYRKGKDGKPVMVVHQPVDL